MTPAPHHPDAAGHAGDNPTVFDDPSVAHNARLGLIFFGFYSLIYAAFVVLVAFAPTVMRKTLDGVNLAVVYGMGLIVLAIVMACLYAFLCKTPDASRQD